MSPLIYESEFDKMCVFKQFASSLFVQESVKTIKLWELHPFERFVNEEFKAKAGFS